MWLVCYFGLASIVCLVWYFGWIASLPTSSDYLTLMVCYGLSVLFLAFGAVAGFVAIGFGGLLFAGFCCSAGFHLIADLLCLFLAML